MGTVTSKTIEKSSMDASMDYLNHNNLKAPKYCKTGSYLFKWCLNQQLKWNQGGRILTGDYTPVKIKLSKWV